MRETGACECRASGLAAKVEPSSRFAIFSRHTLYALICSTHGIGGIGLETVVVQKCKGFGTACVVEERRVQRCVIGVSQKLALPLKPGFSSNVLADAVDKLSGFKVIDQRAAATENEVCFVQQAVRQLAAICLFLSPRIVLHRWKVKAPFGVCSIVASADVWLSLQPANST